MKNAAKTIAALFAAAFLLATGAALAQTGGPYDLSWSVVAGGGGTSTGGQYVLSDTIGQAAAGMSTGGSYTLFDGFWAYDATVVIPLELSGIMIR